MFLQRDWFSQLPFLRLKPSCRLVRGAVRAAIYDLDTGKVYSVNSTGRKILERLQEGEWNVLLDEDICSKDDLVEFLQQLDDAALLSDISAAFPDKPKPAQDIDSLARASLRFMWLELTERCNLRCLHCYADAGSTTGGKSLEMGMAFWQSVLEQGVAAGCRNVQFIGGEPLLCSFLPELLSFARNCEYEMIEVFTNGTLLTEPMIEQFARYGIRVATSIYSDVASIHDSVTRVPGSFYKTDKTLRLLAEYQVPTRVAVIIMRENQDSAHTVVEYLERLGFPSIVPDIIRPTGRGADRDLLPTDSSVLDLRIQSSPSFRTNETSFHWSQRWNPCWAGEIAVTSAGKVIPCIFGRSIILGDLTTQSLDSVLGSENLLACWGFTKDKVSVCSDCEYRYACGDCRPLALGESGDLQAKYPRCRYNPYAGHWMH